MIESLQRIDVYDAAPDLFIEIQELLCIVKRIHYGAEKFRLSRNVNYSVELRIRAFDIIYQEALEAVRLLCLHVRLQSSQCRIRWLNLVKLAVEAGQLGLQRLRGELDLVQLEQSLLDLRRNLLLTGSCALDLRLSGLHLLFDLGILDTLLFYP